MTNLPQRKSIRLKNYNYSQDGCYFVTICTQNRIPLFGSIQSVGVDPCVNPNPCVMKLNDIGKMVNQWWGKIPDKFPNVKLDASQIMPNHFHGIVIITNNGRTHGSAPTVGTIIQWFKTMITNDYLRNIKLLHWPLFNKRVWQRNFYERIIRNEFELQRIRKYIILNPQMWSRDRNNLDAVSK